MDLVAVGDLTLDIKTAPMSGVPERDTQKIVDDLFLELGGQTANCAVAAAALGMETRLIAKAGSDLFGNWLLDYLKKAGVEAKVNADPAVKTSTTLALCFDDSSRSFISTQESNNSLSLEDVDFELVEGGHLHRGGYWNCASLLGGPTEKLFRHAVDNGMETSLDIGWDHGGWTDERKEGVFKILENCTILFINPQEYKALTGEDDVEKAGDFLLDKGVEIIAFHLGENGSMARTRKETAKAAPFETKPVNPTGVGDEYNAAFIYGLSQKWPLEKITKFANAAASVYLSRPRGEKGNPSAGEVMALL